MNKKRSKSDFLNKLVRQNVIFASFYKMKHEDGSEKTDKTNQIIETAQKRFGLYGVEKTSMREIASDLNLSKASLYYYFPDKENLYKAVVEKEQQEFLSKISESILSIQDPEELLREYVNVRLTYFRTLLNLSRLRIESFSDLKPVFRNSIHVFREKEKEIITGVLVKGINSGLFSVQDPDQVASLFLDLLKGLRVSLLNEKGSLFIEPEEYDMLLKKTMDFTVIFIKGLKKN